MVGKVIWSKPGKVDAHYVGGRLRVPHWKVRAAIHSIKGHGGLRGSDNVVIHEDGDVTDHSGDLIGNIYDEI